MFLPFFFVFCFAFVFLVETQSHGTYAGVKFTIWPRLTLNSWPSYLYLPGAGIAGVCLILAVLGIKPKTKPRALCKLGKHSTNPATTSAPHCCLPRQRQSCYVPSLASNSRSPASTPGHWDYRCVPPNQQQQGSWQWERTKEAVF